MAAAVVPRPARDMAARSPNPAAALQVDAERVLHELGSWRRFHLQSYALLAVATFSAALYGVNYVFLAGDVPYRCMVEECEPWAVGNSSILWVESETEPAWLEAARPGAGASPRDRRCLRRAPNIPGTPATPGGACGPHSFSDHLQPCEHWLYASRDTIVAEFNLACQEWKRTLVGTIHNIGMLVSLPIFGYISDRWGRKPALVLSCSLVGAVGSLKAFSVSYEMYVLVEFLETVAGASAFPAAYIMTIELLGQDKRVLTTVFLGITLVVGGLSFALLARAFRYWRTFILVAYPPSLLFVSYAWLMPESIRWLLSKGRREEAADLILKAAKMNGVTLSDETLKQLAADDSPTDKSPVEPEAGLWRQVARSRVVMTRLAICSWWWITCTFVFYGLAINSVSLAGDKYTNFMLVVSVEVIAVVANALLLDRWGRKRTLLTAYVLCGIACVSLSFVPPELPWLATLLYLGGKVCITQAFSGVYLYTSELFPTSARHSLLGLCSMVGRTGSIVAPQMPLLAVYVEWLPSALFGGAALLAGALMLLTPETLRVRLPDTIADAERMARSPAPAPSPAPAKDGLEMSGTKPAA